MRQSVCINEVMGDYVKPRRVADIQDNELVEISDNKYLFIKTDNHVILEPGKVGLWNWDDTDNTNQFSTLAEPQLTLYEVIYFKQRNADRGAVKWDLVIESLKSGIETGKKFIDNSLDVLLIVRTTKSVHTGLVIPSSYYHFERGKISLNQDTGLYSSLEVFTIPENKVISNNQPVLVNQRSICAASSVKIEDQIVLIHDRTEVAKSLILKIENREKHTRKKRESLGKRPEKQVIQDLLDSKELLLPPSEREVFLSLKNDPELIQELYNQSLGVSDFDYLLSVLFLTQSDVREEISKKMEEQWMKSKEKEIEKLETKIRTLHSDQKSKEDRIKDLERKIDSLETEYSKKESELESDWISSKDELTKSLSQYSDEVEEKKKECSKTLAEQNDKIAEANRQYQEISTRLEEVKLEYDQVLKINSNSLLNEGVFPHFFKSFESNSKRIEESINNLSSGMAQIREIIQNKTSTDVSYPDLLLKIDSPKGDSEHIADPDKLTDALIDNLEFCGVCKDNDFELAEFILTSLAVKGKIVITGDHRNVIGDCVSAVLLGKKSTTVCYDEAIPVSKFVSQLNLIPDDIIVIEGILSRSDYGLFFAVCKFVDKKLIIHTDDSSMLDLCPPELWVHAAYLDMSGEDTKMSEEIKFFESSLDLIGELQIDSDDEFIHTLKQLVDQRLISFIQMQAVKEIYIRTHNDSKYCAEYLSRIIQSNGVSEEAEGLIGNGVSD